MVRRDQVLSKLKIRLPDAVAAVAIPALAVSFGLQCLRVLVPGLTWILDERFHLSALGQAAVLLAVFSSAFLVTPLRRRLGYRMHGGISLGGLIACRLFIQFWPGDPLASFVAACIGVGFFVMFLPVYLDEIRHREAAAMPFFAGGFLLGFILDTLTSGASGTYDLAWQQSFWPSTIIVVLTSFLILTLIQDFRRLQSSAESEVQSRSGAWIAVGPFLFLQLTIFQNLPAQSSLSGFTTAHSFLWLIGAQLFALAGSFFIHTKRSDTVFLATVFSAGILVTYAFFPFPTGWIETVFVILGQAAITQLFFAILLGMSASTKRGHIMSLTLASAIGMIALGLLIVGYSPTNRMALRFDNSLLIMLAAVMVAGAAMTSLRYSLPRLHIGFRPWLTGGVICLVILALPAWQSVHSKPLTMTAASLPLRILSLNIHNGFNADGKLDLEGLAHQIELSGADVIALQEVARGSLETGRTDSLEWLARRLNMVYYFGPTDGSLWGNAILSRYPLISQANIQLPSEALQLQRGFVTVVIEVNGQPIQIIDTELNEQNEGSAIRIEQLAKLVQNYHNTPRTIIMGDFNAEPGSPEVSLIRNAGFIDVVTTIEPPPALTYPSRSPVRRFDYIWVSPDIIFTGVGLLPGTASNHFGIVATVIN